MGVRVCGVCGGSGAGKTTLARQLVEYLGPENVTVLDFDGYYRDLSHITPTERSLRNYDHPDALDHDGFVAHLDALRAGDGIDVPIYDFATHTFSGRVRRLEAAPLVVVDGILLLALPEIVARLDFSVFLDVPESIRLERRVRRDAMERGRDPADVRRQFATTVAPMHARFVEPYRDQANRVVGPEEPYDAVVAELARYLALSRVG